MRGGRTPELMLVLGVCCGLVAGCSARTELAWNEERGYRWAQLETGAWGEAGFERLAPSKTGITFENRITEEEIGANQHYMNGSGVAAGDVDGDGWVDLYFARLNGPNRLYKNTGGFVFRDVTDSAGVAHADYYSTGAVFADVDGDRDLDLLVTALTRENALYLNDGHGRFTRRRDVDLGSGKGSHTMALADVDGDGDLDLYVANYKEKSVKDLFPPAELAWGRTIKERYSKQRDRYTLIPPFDEHYTILTNNRGLPNRLETGETDALYLNAGDGTFREAVDPERRFLRSDGAPMGLPRDWGLTAKFQDINQDGLPDLYVCNDFWTPDRLWINQGDGVFREPAPVAIRNASFSSMTVDFSDIDGDGALDFFTTEMLSPHHDERLRQYLPEDPFPTDRIDSRPKYTRNSLYLNRGDDTFAEISYFSGLEASGWSWATRFMDVDFDGYEDLLVLTGFSYDLQDIDSQLEIGMKMSRASEGDRYLTQFPRLPLQNKAYRNNGDRTFSERSADWGFTEKDISHGLATADFDLDGDLDLAVNRLNDVAAVYENETPAPRVAVRLLGNPPNTQAIGAKVTFEGGPTLQRDELTAGGDYLSGSDPTVVFVARADNPNHVLTVTWPDGGRTTIDSVRADRIYEIQQPPTAGPAPAPAPPGIETAPHFADASGKLRHRHHESPYDDFLIQPLLPAKLSRQGPGVSWIDFDADGDDDLFVASGAGGALAVYENDGGGSFSPRSLGAMTETTEADQTTILGWSTEGTTRLLVGQANYEAGIIAVPSARRYAFQDGSVSEHDGIPGLLSTSGPLAAADYDGDGDLDLFVGGRFVPAQYPANATSRLFKEVDGRFVQDEDQAGLLKELGLVTGAVFTDYDLDGDPDLLLSLEWDALRLFRNEEGRFRDVSEEMGLAQHRGWWNGVATGDFNSDGRPDIVATNWGLNSPYRLGSGRPLKMYYRESVGNRPVEIVESYFDAEIGSYVPRRQLNAFESSSLAAMVGGGTHRQFGRASLREILGAEPESRLSSKTIDTVAHTLFLNGEEGFSAHPLPAEAQFSVAFHAGVADFDNDGNEDLFLSQNVFAVRPTMPRLDAGRGIWLRGDGQGGFDVVPGHVSGVEVYGEQRGAAFSDYNGDGKVDLAVSQNGNATKLYENRTPKPGLTIRLTGPPRNRGGIGSSLRLVYDDGSKGPRREVQAGSGYWSQNSASQVLGAGRSPTQVEVTWPDGRVSTVDLPDGVRVHAVAYPAPG